MKCPDDLFEWPITLRFRWNGNKIRTLVSNTDTVADLIDSISEYTRIPPEEIALVVGKYTLQRDWTVEEMKVPREAVIDAIWLGYEPGALKRRWGRK